MFGFGTPLEWTVHLEGESHRPIQKQKGKELEDCSSSSLVQIFSSDEDVLGEMTCNLPPGKKIEHVGIKIEFIGEIEIVSHGTKHEFTSIMKELAPVGCIENGKVGHYKMIIS